MRKNDGYVESRPTLGGEEVAGLAEELNGAIFEKCERLAERALGIPEYNTDEWVVWLNAHTTEERRSADVAVHLVRLQVLRTARADLERAVVAARRDHVTWQQIGDACGMTRSAAHDRWGRAARQQAEKDAEDAGVFEQVLIVAAKTAAAEDRADKAIKLKQAQADAEEKAAADDQAATEDQLR